MYGIGGFGGMGGFGGGYGGNPQFQNAVGQHLGNMMGGQAAQGMGNQMGYAPSPGYNPQHGQMLMNPNYGQMPAPAPRPMPMPNTYDWSRLTGGGSPWGAPVNNDWAYGRQTMDAWHSRPTYGGAPQPHGGAVHNDQRQYANGDQYHNAKGNLRMRYRDGGQMAGQAPY